MRKERRQYPAILTEEACIIKDLFYDQIISYYRGFDSQRFVLLLFSV